MQNPEWVAGGRPVVYTEAGIRSCVTRAVNFCPQPNLCTSAFGNGVKTQGQAQRGREWKLWMKSALRVVSLGLPDRGARSSMRKLRLLAGREGGERAGFRMENL